MKLDHAARMSILYDYYGQLLTEKQRRIFTFYHDDNLSLAEIGEELEVSKQGVHDALKKAEFALEEFENKLGLVKNNIKNEDLVNEIRIILSELTEEKDIDKKIKIEIKKAEENIEKLNL